MTNRHVFDGGIHAMRPEERDRWWLGNVYRGDAPQLTARVVISGFLLGGLLSITNLYVGAKVGASLGVAVTAVIVAFAAFRVMHRLGLGSELRCLENNVLQSIASSAGYMCSPLTASMGAYMMVSNSVVPWWQMLMWLLGLAVMGVVFAVPLKRRVINEAQLPFPEGQACGSILATLHGEQISSVESQSPPPLDAAAPASRRAAPSPAKLLLMFAATAGATKLLQAGSILERIRLGFLQIPEALDAWYYRIASQHDWWIPRIAGVSLRDLTVRPTLDAAMMGLGGLMGIRTCVSLMIGAIVNYLILAPWMIARGDIPTQIAADGFPTVGFRAITTWSLWCGVAMMTTASLYAFCARLKTVNFLRDIRFQNQKRSDADPLRDIELPRWLFIIGVPVCGAYFVWIADWFFGVAAWMVVIAIPLIFVLTIIGVHATALTSITPHGALGKITQLTYGVIAPRNITTNIATAGISAEVAFQTSNVIQNLKPGYMLGGKPRLQVIGHLIGAVSGAVFSVAVFYPLFLRNNPSGIISQDYPFPAITVWRAVAEVLTQGFSGLAKSAVLAALFGAAVGVALEIIRTKWSPRFAPAPVAMGLAFMIPFDICLAMFVGAATFWACGNWPSRSGRRIRDLLSANREPICAGSVAGAALVGVLTAAVNMLIG